MFGLHRVGVLMVQVPEAAWSGVQHQYRVPRWPNVGWSNAFEVTAPASVTDPTLCRVRDLTRRGSQLKHLCANRVAY